MKKLFVNLGNSLIPSDRPGILAEAQEKFGSDRKVVVIAFEGDRLLKEIKLPEEFILLLVKEDGSPTQEVKVGPDDVFILNGGMTPQQTAMTVHLSQGCTLGQVVNMQRERCVVMVSSRKIMANQVAFNELMETLDYVARNSGGGDAGECISMSIHQVQRVLGVPLS